MYEYEAMSDEELSFKEGDIIKVLQKEDDGMDDGFWTGEVHGKKGVFPSLVVEEFTEGYGSTENSTLNVPNKTGNGGLGDYVTLPSNYTHKAAPPAAPASGLQPSRRAPPPPASPQPQRSNNTVDSLEPVDRKRSKTENPSSMRRPAENQASYQRPLSQDGSTVHPVSMYENINQLSGAASKNPPDYVNINNLPTPAATAVSLAASGNKKPVAQTRPKAPPKPPPPSTTKRAYMSKSYV